MASPTHSTTTTLVRKRSDTDLIPAPPPAKKIKRPRRVLDEDSYTEALSHIIARDFFPGLLETEIQQEYLDAVDSKDPAWISSASRRLHHVMTPGRRGKPPSSSQHAKTNFDQGRTPTSFIGDTPASTSASVAPSVSRFDTNMSLTKFQATYTSEDNESFYKLIDKHNQKRADKYAWIWRGNKLPSKQMIKQKEVCDRLAKTRSLVDDGFKRDRLAIKDRDERPAQPDSWKAAPRNGLMFEPDLADDVVTVAQRAEEASRMAPRSIEYANTRVPMPHIPSRPPSPTMSSIKDAVAGRPRKHDQDSSVLGGGETPRVNGYSFVDDEEDESEEPKGPAPINLGPGDAHNPFKLLQQRRRELLHERMVDRISKSNKEAARHGLAAKVASPQVPKFASGPRISGDLTPAAQRLWNSMKTPRHKTPGSSFGKSTPMKPRGSLL